MLTLSPHIIADYRDDGLLLWADARGLPASRIARTAVRTARRAKIPAVSVGVSRVALIAEIAARTGTTPLTVVATGEERRFIAPHPLALLAVTDAVTHALPITGKRTAPTTESTSTASAIMRRTRLLIAAFNDVGIETCDDLARLTREAVEVRFGANAVALWRLARADDTRLLFRHRARALPSASLEWFEFELRDPERLVFIVNRLAEQVCSELQSRGETARAMTLTFALAGGGTVVSPVRCARPTADRATWLRLVRAVFERIRLPDNVSGLTLSVEATQSHNAPQGDLFDRGFQTSAAGEAAVAQLIDDKIGAAVQSVISSHALPEHRVQWRPMETGDVTRALNHAPVTSLAVTPGSAGQIGESLALRLLTAPRRVVVTTHHRRGFAVPVRYREQLANSVRAKHDTPLIDVLTAAGPDRMSVGQESGTAVVREYWQCFNGDGQFVLLFRDATSPTPDATASAESVWYLHGWWD